MPELHITQEIPITPSEPAELTPELTHEIRRVDHDIRGRLLVASIAVLTPIGTGLGILAGNAITPNDTVEAVEQTHRALTTVGGGVLGAATGVLAGIMAAHVIDRQGS